MITVTVIAMVTLIMVTVIYRGYRGYHGYHTLTVSKVPLVAVSISFSTSLLLSEDDLNEKKLCRVRT